MSRKMHFACKFQTPDLNVEKKESKQEDEKVKDKKKKKQISDDDRLTRKLSAGFSRLPRDDADLIFLRGQLSRKKVMLEEIKVKSERKITLLDAEDISALKAIEEDNK